VAITPSQIRVSPLAITRPTLDNLVSSYRQEIKRPPGDGIKRLGAKTFSNSGTACERPDAERTHVLLWPIADCTA